MAASRDRSVTPSRDGSVLIRAPSSSTCRLIASAQRVTCRPDRAGPSQTCCPPICKFPEGGTTRSTSTAGWPSCGVATTGWGAASTGRLLAGDESGAGRDFCWPVLGVSWAGMRSSRAESAGVNRLAGNAPCQASSGTAQAHKPVAVRTFFTSSRRPQGAARAVDSAARPSLLLPLPLRPAKTTPVGWREVTRDLPVLRVGDRPPHWPGGSLAAA